MRKNAILHALLKHKFRKDKSDTGGPFGLYVKFYPVVSIAVYFNHSTGELYGIRFASDVEMYAYPKKSESITRREEGCVFPSLQSMKEKIDLLQSINVQHIVKPADLERAMTFFDFRVETEMLGGNPDQPFQVGERVVCWHPKKGYQVGGVMGYVSAGVMVEIEAGRITVPIGYVARVCNTFAVTMGTPGGEWGTISDKTLQRIAEGREYYFTKKLTTNQ